jgi:hypothetical protein
LNGIQPQKVRPPTGPFNRAGILVLAAALLTFHAPAASAQGSSVFLPNAIRQFEFPFASPRASAMVGRVMHVSTNESQFGREWEAEAGLGEMWPILAVARGKTPVTLHFGAEAYGRFSLGDAASALISNDWNVNLILTADFRALRLGLEAYHESSHLGDEYRDRFPGPRVNWSREIVGLWSSYRVGLVTLHANASYAPISALDVPGGAIAVAVDHLGKRGGVLGGSAQSVLALHADAQEYSDWRVSWSGRAGVRFADPVGRRGFALLLSFYDGYSNQKQFFNRISRHVGMEVRFDL